MASSPCVCLSVQIPLCRDTGDIELEVHSTPPDLGQLHLQQPDFYTNLHSEAHGLGLQHIIGWGQDTVQSK